MGLVVVGGTVWAVGALLFTHVARVPHRIEVQGRVVTAQSALRRRRVELPPEAKLELEVQQRPKGRFVRIFSGDQVLLPFVPADDEPRFVSFVRAANANGAGTLVVPKGALWTPVVVMLVLGAVLLAAAFSPK